MYMTSIGNFMKNVWMEWQAVIIRPLPLSMPFRPKRPTILLIGLLAISRSLTITAPVRLLMSCLAVTRPPCSGHSFALAEIIPRSDTREQNKISLSVLSPLILARPGPCFANSGARRPGGLAKRWGYPSGIHRRPPDVVSVPASPSFLLRLQSGRLALRLFAPKDPALAFIGLAAREPILRPMDLII
jgi:hypothetical protein